MSKSVGSRTERVSWQLRIRNFLDFNVTSRPVFYCVIEFSFWFIPLFSEYFRSLFPFLIYFLLRLLFTCSFLFDCRMGWDFFHTPWTLFIIFVFPSCWKFLFKSLNFSDNFRVSVKFAYSCSSSKQILLLSMIHWSLGHGVLTYSRRRWGRRSIERLHDAQSLSSSNCDRGDR